jgi:L-cystine uptake protein TcyP (sodium:dicarboxylate symporter family)
MSPLLQAVLNWLRQPSSVTGVSALAASSFGLLTGQLSPTAALPAIVFGIVAILLPDNTAAQSDIRKVVADTLALAQSGSSAAAGSIPLDIAALNADLGAPAAGKAARPPLPDARMAIVAPQPENPHPARA